MSDNNDRVLPDREIAYHYTAAMVFAQELELNLRAMVYTIDYSIAGLEDTEKAWETKRYGSFNSFLERATICQLRQKMQISGILWPDPMWEIIDQAQTCRNELAHHYFNNFGLPAPNDEQKKAIIRDLQGRSILLYKAVMVTRAARERIESESERLFRALTKSLVDLDISSPEINKGLWKNRDRDRD